MGETNTIICLSVFQQPFWPHFNNPLVVSGLRVTLTAETTTSGYQSVCLQLEVEDMKHSVQIIFCPNWPHLSVPVSTWWTVSPAWPVRTSPPWSLTASEPPRPPSSV